MKRLAVTLAAVCAVASLQAKEEGGEPDGVQKVMLKISTVETVGTRTQKTWNPPSPPSAFTEVPYDEAALAKATPEEAKAMSRENMKVRRQNQEANKSIAVANWLAASEHYEGIKKQLEGTVFGRQVILALDKFAGIAGECFDPDCIEFFHRMDNDEGEKEQFLKDMGSADTVSAPYFIKLIFDDPRIETGKTVMNGQEFSRTKTTISVTFQVQDLSGKIIASGNVKKEKVRKGSNAVQVSGGSDADLIDTMEDALREVAKRINDRFVAKTTIKLLPPSKKDKGFDPDEAVIEVDGVQQDAETEFSVMRGSHVITVEMDGYKQKGSCNFQIKKSGTIKIKMKKTEEEKDEDEE